MKDDVAWPQLLTAPDGRRIETRRETDKDHIRSQPNIGDARKILLTAQQMELAQLGPGQSGNKSAAAGDDKLDLRFADARLIIAGLGESICAISRHFVRLVRWPTRRDAEDEPDQGLERTASLSAPHRA